MNYELHGGIDTQIVPRLGMPAVEVVEVEVEEARVNKCYHS